MANATAKETLDEIRVKAPQQYYTQNRMITGEDYNILPYTAFSTILKAKAVNRTSSGVSRFLDVLDVTGKYSSTNVFGSDGILYREEYFKKFSFAFTLNNEIYDVIYNKLYPLLDEKSTKHFHYAKARRYSVDGVSWDSMSKATNANVGKLVDIDNNALTYGSGVSSNLKYISVGSMMRFRAPAGYHFTASGKIKAGDPKLDGDSFYIYAAVANEDRDANTLTINQIVPSKAILDQIIPAFKTNMSDVFIRTLVNLIRTYRDFAIRYDDVSKSWKVIDSQYIGGDTYSNEFAGSTQIGADSSWLIKFIYDGNKYNVSARALDYLFESVVETKFYYDNKVKVFDSKTGRTINDYIKVLKFNSNPDSTVTLGQDYSWFVYKNVVEADGYENNRKVLVTFPDFDNDGIPDNPDLFELIVNPDVDVERKYVFFVSVSSDKSFVNYVPVAPGTITSEQPTKESILLNIDSYDIGQIFYAYQENKFYSYSIIDNKPTAVEQRDYIARVGRPTLSFHYRHNSPNYRRIDPSPNNIMDLYILTKTYANDYVTWIKDSTGNVSEPVAPTNEELRTEFNELENYKAMSDTIVYNSARFKPLFGDKAEPALRARFKVVKNPNVVISDNDIKTSVVAAINAYFDVNNWDFGETFYFSELSAYLHQVLVPNIASIIVVPADENSVFGSLYQINCQPDEIVVSAASVSDVEVIPSITAAQINQALTVTDGSQLFR